MLIVAPKGVYRNWYKSEIPKHMPEHISYKMACWNPTPRKAEKMEMDAMKPDESERCYTDEDMWEVHERGPSQ